MNKFFFWLIMLKRIVLFNLGFKLTLKFYKNSQGAWYVDFPEYIGAQENLRMVMGADDLLDGLTNYEAVIDQRYEFKIGVGNSVTDRQVLSKKEEKDLSYGRTYDYYDLDKSAMKQFEVWLCPVMIYTFGRYPQYLNIKFIK